MNKPQYLAELGQLLIFMTRADREKTLGRYGALFDAADPAGQGALLAKLGSTTRQAIRLSRIYDAAGYEDEFLDGLEAEVKAGPVPAPEQKPDPAHPTPLVEEDLPDYELPNLPDPPAASGGASPKSGAVQPQPGPAPVQPAPSTVEAAPDNAPGEAAGVGTEGDTGSGEDDDAEYEELWGKRPAPPEKAAPAAPEDKPDAGEEPETEVSSEPVQPAASSYTTVERVIPLWAGAPLFVLTVIFIVLPIAVVCLALLPAFLVPGLAVLLGAWLAFVGGLWCISIIADAAVLFGSALILLALGLLILWCGLWLDVGMVSGFIRALRGLANLTLGKKVTVHA